MTEPFAAQEVLYSGDRLIRSCQTLPACRGAKRIPGLLREGSVAYLGVVAIRLYLQNCVGRSVLAWGQIPALQLLKLGQLQLTARLRRDPAFQLRPQNWDSLGLLLLAKLSCA